MTASASWQDTAAPAPAAARRRALRAARRHSRSVRVLRVLLPTAAVAAITAFFMLTHLGLPIPFDLNSARLSITPNSIVMERPNLTGFDAEQREYSIEAARAIQSLANPDQVRLEAIKATIRPVDRGPTHITADAGHYDHGRRTLQLQGEIAVDSPEGYALRMSNVNVDFAAGTMQSAEPVTVIYADSKITGQRFVATESGRRILFDGGVSTTLMPPKRETSDPGPARNAE